MEALQAPFPKLTLYPCEIYALIAGHISSIKAMGHCSALGIICCHSKKETKKVAADLVSASNGAIQAGVYHADIPNAWKLCKVPGTVRWYHSRQTW